jgi:hypothetical protein
MGTFIVLCVPPSNLNEVVDFPEVGLNTMPLQFLIPYLQ